MKTDVKKSLKISDDEDEVIEEEVKQIRQMFVFNKKTQHKERPTE